MIALFINPHAGKVSKKARLQSELVAMLTASNQGEVFAPVSLDALDETMKALLARVEGAPEMIAVCGGDGSLRAITTAIHRARPYEPFPPLVLLPAGTINTTAKNLGIPRRPVALLSALLASRAAAGPKPDQKPGVVRVKRHPLLVVNNQVGSVFGAAMVGRFFEMYCRLPRRGALTVAKLGVQITTSALVGGKLAKHLFAPTQAMLTIDGKIEPVRPYTLLLASTLPEAGLHLRPTYRGGAPMAPRVDVRKRATMPGVPVGEGGGMHVVASGLPASVLARQIPAVFRGRPLIGQPHLDTMAATATFAFERAEPCMLDGDGFSASHVDVRLLPPATFLIPATPGGPGEATAPE